MLKALQASAFAQTIAQSQAITAGLSALHVLGFSLIMSGALVFGLRSMGRLFADRPPVEILRPAARLLFVGLAVNVVTGALMFSTRGTSAVANGFFQTKMSLLLAALVVQVLVTRGVMRRANTSDARGPGVLAGAAGLVLWVGVAMAGAAFILIE